MRSGLVVAWLLLMSATSTVHAQDRRPTSDCLRYEPDSVRLVGTMRRHTFPGPPNYESIRNGDMVETGYYLHLDRPVCTVGKDEINVPLSGVRFVQLVLDSAGYARLRPLLGRRVALRGTLFAEHTGHHHAPLLLVVAKPGVRR